MVILVDAPEPYGQGFCWYLVPEFSHSHADREDMLAGVATSRELLLETILAEAEAHGLPPSRWCLIGFSQGCTMVLEAALRGVAFAGVIGISGFLPTLADYPAAFGAAAQQTPLLITHGRFDPVVPFERGELMFQTLKGLGCQVEFGAYNKEHSLDPENEVPHLRAFLQAHG
jgi:phospholipase/carboxylesterase